MASPALIVLTQPAALVAQVAPVKIHGHVTNVEGMPFNKGDVRLTLDKAAAPEKRKYLYTFPIGPDGNYTGAGISPGDYLLIVYAEDKSVDYQNLVLKPGEDRTIDFDMTREEYLKDLKPEDRAAIEANKKKNAGILAENNKIQNINATLGKARADEKSGKPDEAVASLQGIIDGKPNEAFLSVVYSALGEAQLASADAAVAAARAAKTNTSSPEIQAKYLAAAASYKQAIDLGPKSQKPSPPETVAAIYMNMGNALAKGGKTDDAVVAYNTAASTSPTTAGTAYFNEAAVLYNMQQLDQAGAAAEKAIAADPKRAMAYYIKAQALIPKATVDTKTQKIVAPPGCVEAYQQYLELDPTGAHATEVRDLLTNLGQPIKSSYKAGKK